MKNPLGSLKKGVVSILNSPLKWVGSLLAFAGRVTAQNNNEKCDVILFTTSYNGRSYTMHREYTPSDCDYSQLNQRSDGSYCVTTLNSSDAVMISSLGGPYVSPSSGRVEDFTQVLGFVAGSQGSGAMIGEKGKLNKICQGKATHARSFYFYRPTPTQPGFSAVPTTDIHPDELRNMIKAKIDSLESEAQASRLKTEL